MLPFAWIGRHHDPQQEYIVMSVEPLPLSEATSDPIRKIGVVGAGLMGNGIAHVCALAGIEVVLTDIRAEALDRAMTTIRVNLDRQIKAGLTTEQQKAAALTRIVTAVGYDRLSECDLVVEAITEKEEAKKALYKLLAPHMKPDCILATNTSSISITRLGASTDRPEKFIGLHFMNPVPVMKLVEIIRGIATDDRTFAAVSALAQRLDKTISVAEDFPAFIVNRILVPMINEAVFALYEGVATVSGIDTAMRLGASHRMGPLELADFIGLDTCLSIMQVLYDGLSDSKYRPCPLLVKYVEAGWLGRKTGRGFYDYAHTPPRPTR
ncbi:3-hydroxybutyryl-CoA dehydrogenase [Granulibacter bethesdensis]|uniref:3-hydroxybutyryl-CoA dehydrogenase n=2 Tax=Granulibacter bethesdensis TaxID=364410 RepID=A0AAN0VGJ4_9PROT|nr:3-hydroxybutyryl-CoA dehydrogenase [Granulibacter bethesdensis]AHJ65434.1 3-hydroxybutyryl-CoA dehydrogenase [Granulibacter bethesdensis CGDNIH4]AHJ68047.1 3-hydroxybutyryl-CoA dehydrogenase [Granulibacter bethesdensis]